MSGNGSNTNEGHRVLLTIPCGDGRIETLTMISVLQACAMAGAGDFVENPNGAPYMVWGDALRGPFILAGNSNIRDARNKIVHYFKTQATDCDRLIMLDSDIAFTPDDFTFLLEGDEDIVIAPYSRKSLGEPPVSFGCGFARVHRRVFDKLDAWLLDDGSEALRRYYMRMTGPRHETEMAVDYFFDGPGPNLEWYGEDTGFWNWCKLIDCSMRMETRTHLVHIGKGYYGYPDQIPGMVAKNAGAQ